MLLFCAEDFIRSMSIASTVDDLPRIYTGRSAVHLCAKGVRLKTQFILSLLRPPHGSHGLFTAKLTHHRYQTA